MSRIARSSPSTRKPPANPDCACPHPACSGPPRHDKLVNDRLDGLAALKAQLLNEETQQEAMRNIQITLGFLEEQKPHCSQMVQDRIDSALGGLPRNPKDMGYQPHTPSA